MCQACYEIRRVPRLVGLHQPATGGRPLAATHQADVIVLLCQSPEPHDHPPVPAPDLAEDSQSGMSATSVVRRNIVCGLEIIEMPVGDSRTVGWFVV